MKTIREHQWLLATVLCSPLLILGMEELVVPEQKACSLSLLNSSGWKLAFRLQCEDEAACTLTLISGQRIDLPLRDYSLIQATPYGSYREWISAPAVTFGIVAARNIASSVRALLKQSTAKHLLLEVQAGAQALGDGWLAQLARAFASYTYVVKILRVPAPLVAGSVIDLFPQVSNAIKLRQPVHPRYVLCVPSQTSLEELTKAFAIMNWFWEHSIDSTIEPTVLCSGRGLLAAAYESLTEDEDFGLQVDLAHFQRRFKQLLSATEGSDILFAEDNPIQKANEHYISALHRAAMVGRKEIISTLIARGVDLNTANENGKTALNSAAFFGHKDIVDLLLIHGAQVQCTVDERHLTSLHEAALFGRKEIIMALIQSGVDLNSVGDYGKTALYFAAFSGHKEIVDLLIMHNAQVQCVTDNGCTPLHCAAFSGHKNIVSALIDAKAGVNTQTQLGIFPLSMAANNGHREVVKLLVKCGADAKAADAVATKDGERCIFDVMRELFCSWLKNDRSGEPQNENAEC